MHLDKLFELISTYGIQYITDDSRNVDSYTLFLAYPGVNIDRRVYIPKILSDKKLTNIIILQDTKEKSKSSYVEQSDLERKIIVISFYDLQKNLGLIAKKFYGNLDNYFNISAVTGTNGKTSIVYLLTKALEILGEKTEQIGTLGSYANTTPGAIELQKVLKEFHKQNIKYINIEASSHALVQSRLSGVICNAVMFTNLTPEHLDYHQDMEDYFNAKKKLFDSPYINDKTTIIINHDDNYGVELLNWLASTNSKNEVISYGSLEGLDNLKGMSLYNYKYIVSNKDEIIISDFKNRSYMLKTNLMGLFNLYNILAVICNLYSNKFPIEDILRAINKIKSIPGRMQQIDFSKTRVYVDYAHTSDALESILRELRKLSDKEKLICVFGCGGDRDKLKRPKMGKVAVKYADKVIVTDDNPRTEEPSLIVKDIVKELTHADIGKVSITHDRRNAIKDALNFAKANDIIVIAGKGHEEYQIYGNNKFYFSDFETVKSLLGIGEE